jgi:hypothetical protein
MLLDFKTRSTVLDDGGHEVSTPHSNIAGMMGA